MDPEGSDVFAEPMSDLYSPDLVPRRPKWAATFAAARERQGPANAAAGRAVLRGLIATATARLAGLREAREAAEAADLSDIVARLSHRCTQTIDWLHDHQANCTRALYRAVEELRKLRKNFGKDAAGDPSPPLPPLEWVESSDIPPMERESSEVGPAEFADVPDTREVSERRTHRSSRPLSRTRRTKPTSRRSPRPPPSRT